VVGVLVDVVILEVEGEWEVEVDLIPEIMVVVEEEDHLQVTMGQDEIT